jgi:hypothetical protein
LLFFERGCCLGLTIGIYIGKENVNYGGFDQTGCRIIFCGRVLSAEIKKEEDYIPAEKKIYRDIS